MLPVGTNKHLACNLSVRIARWLWYSGIETCWCYKN